MSACKGRHGFLLDYPSRYSEPKLEFRSFANRVLKAGPVSATGVCDSNHSGYDRLLRNCRLGGLPMNRAILIAVE